ncbi:DNA adenine methylase [Roseicella aerolata]|uniref:site-specific DNA-methyltransferase (cytosine-N(4)-specific) n=1 Tax=Roseicella aerolata TaxID=2883479 RepID=A0A9X1IAK1_9PROT|nr:DNA adenine methylase [Roseicella aerolata]MCB4821254.1 DNA adenine methylase [Roseicella aerolata]
MSMTARELLRRRADYTHKHNLKSGRHGWLRLTPAYSVKVVEDLIERCDRPMRVFDPFSGTGTTALSAAYHGHEGVTTDINPFLVWLGQAKMAIYTDDMLAAARSACRRAVELVERADLAPAPAPPIHNIRRWWSPPALTFLQRLRAAIEATTAAASPERTLLLIAFCRSLIALSNAAFNHQSMSFKEDGNLSPDLGIDMPRRFTDDVHFVLKGAAENPPGSGRVLQADSRNAAAVVEGPFERVITSPPYANRMSYIRELRPYMYWTGHLVNGRDAGELDWSAIGGTWGIATSRLIEWNRADDRYMNPALDSALERIAHADNKNGRLLANYVAKYFDDIWAHFRGLTPVLAAEAEVHYIVGNSTFYGVLLPVEEIYAAMLRSLGFTDIRCMPLRKRNSKKELIEFDVTARWPG